MGGEVDGDASLDTSNRKADEIGKVSTCSKKFIGAIDDSLSDSDALPAITSQSDTINTNLDVVRKRLKRTAAKNIELDAPQSVPSATTHIWVTYYTKRGNDSMNIVSDCWK